MAGYKATNNAVRVPEIGGTRMETKGRTLEGASDTRAQGWELKRDTSPTQGIDPRRRKIGKQRYHSREIQNLRLRERRIDSKRGSNRSQEFDVGRLRSSEYHPLSQKENA